MIVTGVDLNRDVNPDVLHQHQLCYGAPMRCDAQVQYGAPVSCGAAAITAAGVDLNRDGTSDPLQQPQIG